jgi:hypothetical protein
LPDGDPGIRRWAQAWSDDIRRRIYQPGVEEDEEDLS